MSTGKEQTLVNRKVFNARGIVAVMDVIAE
jgi:hypothetical protein